jgi:hypothetical protein
MLRPWSLIACTVGLGCAAATAAPASAPQASSGGATAACEAATRNTLGSGRGPAADVSFNAPPLVQPGAAESTEIILRGAGRVRSGASSRSFTYSCSVDGRTGEVAGVVVRDALPAGGRPPAASRPVEPDLANLSPLACESAAATALKRRWPAVSRIAFNADTRALRQDSEGQADLRGQGTAQPTPNTVSTHFSYQCTLDARSGRVLATRIDD